MTRVVIVDDHKLVRDGLSRILTHHGCEVVGQAGDAEDGLKVLNELRPDVVVWDLIMPGESLEALRSLPQGVRALVLTAVDDPLLACEVARAGAHGFLPKASSPEQLAEATFRVAGGETVFPSLPDLTDRELEILEHMSSGSPNYEIASALKLSVKTIENHVERLKDKLGKDSAAALRAWAARR